VAPVNVDLVPSQADVAGNDGEIVRQPLALEGRSRRRLEERLMVRFPRVLALVSRAVWRLPTRSRLRLALTRRAVISGWEAANRGDFELALALYDPDVETIFDRRMVEIGFEPAYAGRESRLAVQRRATAEWGEWRFEPKELVSIGVDRLLTLGRMNGRGLVSGAAVDIDWGALFTTFDGLVIREQIFLDRGEALEAVGLKQVSVGERTAQR
jgi:ketosteroid isomerase-like protein